MKPKRLRPPVRGGPAPVWLVAGYAGLAGFLVLEGVVRERGSASSLEDSADDQETTRLIIGASVLSALLPPLLRRLRMRLLPRPAGPLGIMIEATGLGMRLWSMRTLRDSYSRTLGTTEGQQVISAGRYRIVRHPGYLGSLLVWAGFAVASGSLPTVAAVTGLLGGAYGRRISAEEQLLVRDLPGYLEYRKRTKRLIPSSGSTTPDVRL